MEIPEFITVRKLAGRVGVREGTIRADIHDGKLPAVKFGSGFRIDPGDVPAWLETRRLVPIRATVRGGDGSGTNPQAHGFRKMAS